MLNLHDKLLIHINTNEVSVYSLKNGVEKLLYRDLIVFENDCITEMLLFEIDRILDDLNERTNEFNNKRIRLYATGVFQVFTQEDKTKLINHIFVNYGLYINIIPQDLELFYLEKSLSTCGVKNLIRGLVLQEFRKVVICGSFQQHLSDIGDIMTSLQRRNTIILSPWTTKIIPESLGTDFILLEGQEPLKNKRESWRHKYEHMEKFKHSDAIIICDPDGIVGKGTMFEFGYMIAFSKRVIFTEEPINLSISFPYEVGLNF